MHATFSIPTNGDNQDVVSMGHLAARAAYEQTERLAAVLAILSLSLAQLDYLRRSGLASGISTPPPPWMPDWSPLAEDRPLYTDIQRISRHFLEKDV
jgi:histidine ammonia-lyase